jgi:hypothetical protein
MPLAESHLRHLVNGYVVADTVDVVKREYALLVERSEFRRCLHPYVRDILTVGLRVYPTTFPWFSAVACTGLRYLIVFRFSGVSKRRSIVPIADTWIIAALDDVYRS